MSDEIEEWRPVQGWPYEVSSLGRVRRSASPQGHRTYVGRFKAVKPGKIGYQIVDLWTESRRRKQYIHILVCEAFHGPRPSPSHLVAHTDGSRTNNRASNLRWATQKENLADDVRNGARLSGEGHHLSKLTEDNVRAILASTENHTATGKRFGVSAAAVSCIRNGRTWRHISRTLPIDTPCSQIDSPAHGRAE